DHLHQGGTGPGAPPPRLHLPLSRALAAAGGRSGKPPGLPPGVSWWREAPMKTVPLAYGKTGLSISVPDRAHVIEPRHLPGLADEAGAVAAALRAPIGTPPLRE